MLEKKPIDSLSLALGALAGAVLTLSVSTLLQRTRRGDSSRRDRIQRSTTGGFSRALDFSAKPKESSIPADLRQEQVSRHTLYFGEQGMKALREARICLVGAGGVGSHAACALARSGLGCLRMVDFDQVSLSSLNRHACAGLGDVGRPKVTVLTEFLQRVCPDPNYLQLDPINEMYTVDTGARILDDRKWSMVVDAIDDIPTKAQLIADCWKRKIRVVSCMGAGGKSDVTRLHVSDLRGAAKDPLATKLRQYLKKLLPEDTSYLDDMARLSIVFSSEKTVVGLADFTDEQKDQGVHQFGAVDGMRIRIIPVLATMPAIMGQALAAVALTEIGGKPFQPVTGERVGRNARNKLLQKLRSRENKLAKQYKAKIPDLDNIASEGGRLIEKDNVWIGPVLVDDEDVEYMMEVWRNRCAVTQCTLHSEGVSVCMFSLFSRLCNFSPAASSSRSCVGARSLGYFKARNLR